MANMGGSKQRGSGAAEPLVRNADTGIWNLESVTAIRDSPSSLQRRQGARRSASYYRLVLDV